MRRLVKHGIAGVGFAAFTVTAAVAALGSPATEDVAIAVPAAVAPVESSAPTASAIDAALEAERTARETRDAQRAELSAAAKTRAGNRAATLSNQSKAIAAQQTKLKAEQTKLKAEQTKLKAEQAKAKARAKAKAKAAAEAKKDAQAKADAKALAAAARAAEAKKRAVKNRGYQPGTKDPRAMARQILKNKFGYGDEQYSCFNYIIMRESMWKVNATNPSSGAYGIPQALPGRKMASAGSDWRTNPATQIIWGIGYMKDRYGSPCQAKTFKAANGWY